MNKIKKLAVVFFIQIIIMVFVSVSVCAQTNAPKDIPLPLQAAGWEGVTVSRVCLKVEQSYPQIEDEFSQPIAETVQRVLKRIGVQVVDEGAPCDATLTFTVTLRARSAYYSGFRLYTGANATGLLELSGEGRPTISVPVSDRFAPPKTAIVLHENPRDAPFRSVWASALHDGLFELWGVEVYIAAFRDESYRVRKNATEALGKIGEPAVEPLIAALKDGVWRVREYAAGALGRITKQDFGRDHAKWQQWWDENKDKVLKSR